MINLREYVHYVCVDVSFINDIIFSQTKTINEEEDFNDLKSKLFK